MKSLSLVLTFTFLTLLGCSGENPVGMHAPGEASESAGVPAIKAGPGTFPGVISLPDGFQPEGIAIGRGTTFYVGSLATGSIYRGDLRTGEGALFASPPSEGVAVGLDVDLRSNLLFAAGGGTGLGYVYDAGTGEPVAIYELTEPGSFVNDVVVTREAAYFTDSFRPVLYRLPLGPAGMLPAPDAVEEIVLGGAFDFVPGAFNTNGIVATANGKQLIIVQTARAALYRVDPQHGEAMLIEGVDVPRGDGLLLQGPYLYVVQNTLNQVAVVRLAAGLTSGEVVHTITSEDFRVPTTVAAFGSALYAVNARFGVTPTPDTEYQVVRVPKR